MPDASLMQRGLLLCLLQLVMAGLAQRLKVRFIPEQTLITTVWLDVVAYQEAGVALDASTLTALAGEQVSEEDVMA